MQNPINGLNGSSPLTILDNRQSFTGIVANFTDDLTADPSAYSATINWGDGSPVELGMVVSDPAGGFDVLGSHSYVFGQYNPSITITAPGENPGDAPRTLSISDNLSVFPPPTACEAFPISAVNGQAFRGTIATYTGLDTTQLNRYSASISWGDGQYSSGQLVLNADGSVSVVGQHVYLNPGFDDVQVTVSANGAAVDTAAATAFCRATIANGFCAGGISFVAESGAPFSGNVAFFQFLGPDQDISHISVQVILSGPNGNPLALSGTVVPDVNGFYVTVSTIFTCDNGEPVEVHIYDSSIPANPALGTDSQLVGLTQGYVAVTDHLIFMPQSASMTAGVESRVFLCHLTSDDPGNLWNKTFDVLIDWGDGDITAGTVTEQYNGVFDISGAYGYVHNSGSMTLKITVTDSSGRSIFTYSNMFLDVDPVSITSGTPTIRDGTVSGNMANFIDDFGDSTDPSEYRVYHAALIDWGDGAVTSGLVTENPDGTYSIASTHDYQADGDYQIHILVRRNTFYAPQAYEPIDPIGIVYAMDAANVAPGSSITADPNSDFGVTFYVHVVGTADRPALAPPPPSTLAPISPVDPPVYNPINILTPRVLGTSVLIPIPTQPKTYQFAPLFSSAAILPTNKSSDPIINSQVYTHPVLTGIQSATIDSWLAGDAPFLDSTQILPTSPLSNSVLSGAPA